MNNKELENRIITGLKNDISIYNFLKEKDKKSSNQIKSIIDIIKKIIIAVISSILVGGSAILVYAYNQTNNIKIISTPYENGNGLQNAVDSGYIEYTGMNYSYSNNIGCKINSIVLSDNDLNFILDFDFSKNPITKDNIYAKIIIYDDEKNVYRNYFPGTENIFQISEKFRNHIYYKKLGLSQDTKLDSSSGMKMISASNTRIETEVMFSHITPEFPKINKFNIAIFDIGYMENDKFHYLFKDVSWNFEIQVPEKFYNRENIKYKLTKEIDGFELKEFLVTDTGTNLIYKADNQYTQIQIMDENGKIYNINSRALQSDGSYSCYSYFNKNMITDRLYLRIFTSEWQEIEIQ